MLIKDSMEQLSQEIAFMSRRAQAIFALSVQCMDKRDEAGLQAVRDMDHQIDDYELKIDNMCISLLLKDPYAVDFRYIFAVSKIIRDLERVGDQSKTIAKWSRKLEGELPDDMHLLARKAGEALDIAVKGLLEKDSRLVQNVMELEFQVDALEDRIIESANNLPEAFIAKSLERIGDLATNITESVIFFDKAQDIRHGGYEA